MRCAWKELLSILPLWMRPQVDGVGADKLQELRLRLGCATELRCSKGSVELPQKLLEEDLRYVVNAACRYSPWSAASASEGYITAQGGHRIGLCGDAVVQGQRMTGLRKVHSLCIRVAKDYLGVAEGFCGGGSVLILGPPGSGKTTFLRDYIRLRARSETVAVVDERGELFPIEGGFLRGKRMDVLTACTKAQGIEMLLRVMGPDVIAVDEITSERDCDGLIKAGWCGVSLLATAHAASMQDLRSRTVYKPLLESRLFQRAVILQRDKSWKAEEIK